MTDRISNTEYKTTFDDLEEGKELVLRTGRAACKVTVKFFDGTEVRFTLHPGSKAVLKRGSSLSVQIELNEPDRIVGHLELIKPDDN
ncbi:MAG: hypothetical protein AVDCRST_MAG93-5903 [uncultured Chloroflexia bacterium]|uniref:Uncharacterized protein n=1 Tax=uncultured Chloroflexia bacterium TaxID=1672391 RepID=A0A6J4L774_9CHLR|nr:MAG: hypothetical protein AVDCRST_MAG93-5903 [uncultured Chloroflexia bacterium]